MQSRIRVLVSSFSSFLILRDRYSNVLGLHQIVLSWIPTSDQIGPQGFCAGAVDNTDVQSDQWCITFLVGYDSPDLIKTSSVQGTASPLGTIFANHTTFSIQGIFC